MAHNFWMKRCGKTRVGVNIFQGKRLTPCYRNDSCMVSKTVSWSMKGIFRTMIIDIIPLCRPNIRLSSVYCLYVCLAFRHVSNCSGIYWRHKYCHTVSLSDVCLDVSVHLCVLTRRISWNMRDSICRSSCSWICLSLLSTVSTVMIPIRTGTELW